MGRLIDADALKADYGMKDDCKDCEKELQGYVRQCQYNAVYTKMDFCEWIDSAPTIDLVRKGHKINQHSYPAKWLCSECGAKHFDFSDKFCSECGVNVEEGE